MIHGGEGGQARCGVCAGTSGAVRAQPVLAGRTGGGLLFVSGQVGSREDGTPEPDLQEQVRLAFRNLNAILHAAGCTFDDVVDVTVFMIDPQSTFERVWQVVPEFWGDAPHPALTAVGVTWLYGFDFEIKVVAKLPVAE